MLYVSAFLFALLLLLVLFRQPLFRWALGRKVASIEKSTGFRVFFDKTRLKLSGDAELEGTSVLNFRGDTALRIETLKLDLSFWGYLTGSHFIRALDLQNGYADVNAFRAKKTVSDTSTRPPDTTAGAQPATEEESTFSKLNRLQQRVSDVLPRSTRIHNLSLRYHDSIGPVQLVVQEYRSDAKEIFGIIRLDDKNKSQQWALSGNNEHGFDCEIISQSKGPIGFLSSRFGLSVAFDRMELKLAREKHASGQLSLRLGGTCKGLSMQHQKLSADTIIFNDLGADLLLHIDREGLAIDTNSTFNLNQIKGSFGLHLPFPKKEPLYALQIKTDWLASTDFFASLPRGVFDDTRGLEGEGKLSYLLDFSLDGRNPDAVMFESSLRRDGFRIRKYGATNLARMSGDFTHLVYEGDHVVRSILVSPENPNFTPLAYVPQQLQNAVLTTEDPSFFYHRGFINEAFKESIADNYKTKSFKRGGSTISMQLVKNVFLSRKKTVFRKIEEALIVWIIENQYLTSKQRMFEVYFNIIEWGPGVYGVAEASRYYFGKRPHELRLNECIYLANIIPKPKKFRYCFDKEGQLRDFMKEQSNFIMKRMVTRNFLSPVDTFGFNPQIILKGPARELVVPVDTIPAEDFFIEEEGE